MKKYASSTLVLCIVVAFMFSFFGCQKLKISNLKANFHLQKANRHYTEEKYAKAIDEYLKALEFNPNLKSLYLYLGTSYSALYEPMKTDERNQQYGEKAVDFLIKADEAFPENEKIAYALGDIYDKMGQFEEAEKYYKGIKEKHPDDPKSYYILADFYSKYNKNDEARAMYEERIQKDSKAEDGYLYYASYGSDRRQWDLSIENHEKRILAIYDPDTLMLKIEIEQMKKDIEKIQAIKENMETVRKHRRLDKAEKTRLLAEAEKRLEDFKAEEELTKLVEEKEKQVEENLKNIGENINLLEEAKKKKLTEAFYTLGVVCWNKSYQTPPNLMAADERDQAIQKGLDACNRVLELEPEHQNAYAFIGLLWLEKIKVDQTKTEEYRANWRKAHDKAKDLIEKRKRREKLAKELEKMGQSE